MEDKRVVENFIAKKAQQYASTDSKQKEIKEAFWMAYNENHAKHLSLRLALVMTA